MINEFRNIFSRSLKIITSYPRILRLSLALAAVNVLVVLESKYDLVCLVSPLSLGASILSFFLQIYFILYVYRIENVLADEVDVWMETRKYFWKFVLQFILGLLVSALISLPFLLLTIMLNRYDKSLGMILLLILYSFFGYISLGTVVLSQQILLHRNFGILKNMKEGMKALGFYQSYYFSFFIITSLITTSLLLIFGFSGAKLTNIDLFSVPIIPISPFLANYFRAISPFIIQLSTQLVYVFVTPYLSIATTLTYLNRSNHELN